MAIAYNESKYHPYAQGYDGMEGLWQIEALVALQKQEGFMDHSVKVIIQVQQMFLNAMHLTR